MDSSDDALIFKDAYCCARHERCDMVVREKIKTDVRGHMTYVLVGACADDESVRFSTLVNRLQWERYDVPARTRTVSEKDRRKHDMELTMNKYSEPRLLPKSHRRVDNRKIERWFAKHYGIDLDRLDGMDVPVLEESVPKHKRRKRK